MQPTVVLQWIKNEPASVRSGRIDLKNKDVISAIFDNGIPDIDEDNQLNDFENCGRWIKENGYWIFN
jgi:hypothetical protein